MTVSDYQHQSSLFVQALLEAIWEDIGLNVLLTVLADTHGIFQASQT
jgi:hypothetical protein